MAKRVFFFGYEDVKTFRANVARNHGVTKQKQDTGFFDASIWEDAKLHGDRSVKKLVDTNLSYTTCTCVLIGSETWKRRWVRYEILKSYDKGNSLFGVHINSVRDKNRNIFANGRNIFKYLGLVISADGKTLTYYEHDGINWKLYKDLTSKAVNFSKVYWGKGFQLSSWANTYDWISDNGYSNFPKWVELAKLYPQS